MLRNARSQFKQNIRWKNYLKTQNFKASPKTKGKDECFYLSLTHRGTINSKFFQLRNDSKFFTRDNFKVFVYNKWTFLRAPR